MAKGSRGGKRGSGGGGGLSGQMKMQQQQPTQPMQIDDTVQAPQFDSQYNNFMGLDDDSKADMISKMSAMGVPDHLAQNSFQKFIYNVGLNDKPDIVDDATLNKMNGTELFRTVNNVYDKSHDIGYSADQIAKQVQAGRVTRVSDNGGSVYGRGIYFADSKSGSSCYGNTRGDVKRTAQIRCKLNSNAKVINHSSAENGAWSEIQKGTKLGKALQKCDSDSRASIYAMAKGYNVITSGSGYYNVLNRNAVTMSKTISPI